MAKLPKSYKITKSGKVVKKPAPLDASAKIRQRTSKKQTVISKAKAGCFAK